MEVGDMEKQELHDKLQLASKQIKEAQESIRLAQGSDLHLYNRAEEQLQHAESELESLKSAGTEAIENSQFQQAYEQLHDTRQQVQEAQQNINDVL